MSFSAVATAGIKKIYSEDFDNQKHYLGVVAKEVRGMEDPGILLKAEAFFVRNEEYLIEYFGKECTDPSYDFYSYFGDCLWQSFVMFPIKNIAGIVVGFVGFDPVTKLNKNTGSEKIMDNHYRYSSASVFNRGKYIYCLEGIYEKAIKDQYIVLTDGVFDMLSLVNNDINSASLLGSSLSEEVLFQLRFIDKLFVAEDNDSAGRELYTKLSKRHPNVRYIRQNKKKDVDDIIKTEFKEMYLKKVREAISLNTDLVLRFKPEK